MPTTNLSPRLDAVLAAIDAANARDPNACEADGRHQPAELVYGHRMSRALSRLAPDASEHLRIAARGQHIERWTTPRASYPEGRAGYLEWRTDLKDFHARRLGEIMLAADYDAADVARVGAMVRKERLKQDFETQTLEDVACVVFLEHYAEPFIAKLDDDTLAPIIQKTWRKMSDSGRRHAQTLPLPGRITAALAPSRS